MQFSTYFTLLQHHKVEMLDSFICVLSDALAKHGLGYDFADIFIHKSVAREFRLSGYILWRSANGTDRWTV